MGASQSFCGLNRRNTLGDPQAFLWFILCPSPGTRPKGQRAEPHTAFLILPLSQLHTTSAPAQERCFSALCVQMALRISDMLLYSTVFLGNAPNQQSLFFFFNFLATPCGMWNLTSLTKDRTHAPCSGSVES